MEFSLSVPVSIVNRGSPSWVGLGAGDDGVEGGAAGKGGGLRGLIVVDVWGLLIRGVVFRSTDVSCRAILIRSLTGRDLITTLCMYRFLHWNQLLQCRRAGMGRESGMGRERREKLSQLANSTI